MYAAAERGDALALRVTATAAAAIGRAVRSLVLSYGVAKVVIGGGPSRAGDAFTRPLLRSLEEERSVSALVRRAFLGTVEVLPPDAQPTSWGAITVARIGLHRDTCHREREEADQVRREVATEPDGVHSAPCADDRDACRQIPTAVRRSNMIRSRTATLLAGLAVTATALSGGAAGVLAQSPAASGGAAVVGVPATPTGYTELDAALGADKPYAGKKVTIQTQWTGGEGEDFAAALANFQTATGIAVQVDSIGSSHETVLKTRIEGGAPPDMAAAGAADRCARVRGRWQGHRPRHVHGCREAEGRLPVDHRPHSDGDHIWGIPYKVDVKSMIWYPSRRSSRPRATKCPRPGTSSSPCPTRSSPTVGIPFCVSAGGPGTATGWELTDWVEEVLLGYLLNRRSPPSVPPRQFGPASRPTPHRRQTAAAGAHRGAWPGCPACCRASMPEIESSVKVTTTRCTLAPVSTITAA